MVDPNSARALRPLRQLALPRWRTLLRAGLVAALLGLAAAVLQTPAGCPPTVVPADAPSVADDPPRQLPADAPSVADEPLRQLPSTAPSAADEPPRQLPADAPSAADEPPRRVDEDRSAASGGASPPDSTGTAGPTS
ncbi:hypothetical protein [Micromonospora sp. C97]|uniref:hypothetical protein n=1 Tax=Micromonospora sp. C97 TaxID=2824883 RepID=UPI001FFC3E5C|nr:hypothetical protein [Micromonospora sp. C97]